MNDRSSCSGFSFSLPFNGVNSMITTQPTIVALADSIRSQAALMVPEKLAKQPS